MIKLVSALAMAQDGVDRAIAFGEAVPRLERLKTIVLAGLALTAVLLAIGYARISADLDAVHTHQRQMQAELEKADADRHDMMDILNRRVWTRQPNMP